MYAFYFVLGVLQGLIFLLCYVHFVKYRSLRNIPGPSVLSSIKIFFAEELTPKDAFAQLLTLNKTYGPVVKIWTNPFKPKLIVTDLEYIEKLLSSFVHLDKTKFYDYFDSFGGLGLTALHDVKWKKERKFLNASFRVKLLEDYVEIFEKYARQWVNELEKNANGMSFDIHPSLNVITLHIICSTLMQTKPSVYEDYISKYLEARKFFYRIMVDRSLSLLSQYDFFFRFTRTYLERESWAAILNDFSKKIIADYLRRSNTAKTSEGHAINLILDKYGADSKETIDHVGVFIVAGHETIAGSISFALYELAKHPKIQKKIVDEAESILGSVAKFSELQNLKYLDCVIKEVLRMYTNVPFYERRTTAEMEIHGVCIPKETEIAISVHNVHMNEENHPNPYVFDPDRFLPENETKMKPFCYIPFCVGPRNCIGKQFAILEMKSLLTKVLRRYEVLPAETDAKMELFSEFTLKSSIGAPVRLVRRG